MINIQFLLPEIFLSISTFALLIIGVFLKNSFELIYRLSIFVIFILILILITGETSIVKIFIDSFIYDKFSIYAAVGILYNHESNLRSENFVSRRIVKSGSRFCVEILFNKFISSISSPLPKPW